MTPRRYGWKPGLAGFYHRQYSLAPPPVVNHVDPLTKGIPIFDQGQTSSCTGNGVARQFQYMLRSSRHLSREYPYYNGRIPEHATGYDEGATIPDVADSLKKYGICFESTWPFDPAQIDTKPSDRAYREGGIIKSRVGSIIPIGDLATLKHYLAQGIPVVFGFTVPASFESDETARTGWVPVPSSSEQVIGGHCMVFDGFDDRVAIPKLLAPNSWGSEWGIEGYAEFDQRWISDSRRIVDDMYAILTR